MEGESLAYKKDVVNFCAQVSASVTANYFAGFQAFGKWNDERQEYEKMEGVLGIAPARRQAKLQEALKARY